MDALEEILKRELWYGMGGKISTTQKEKKIIQ